MPKYTVHRKGGARYIKLGGKVWGVIHVYSSKRAAEAGMKVYSRGARKPLAGGTMQSYKRMVHTTEGWAVVQMSRVKRYQLKSSWLDR